MSSCRQLRASIFVTDMTDEQTNKKDEWPKEVLIKMTIEVAADDLDPDLADDDDIVSNEIGESMETVEIDSWTDIPRGYEPVLDDPDHIASYEEYIRSQK